MRREREELSMELDHSRNSGKHSINQGYSVDSKKYSDVRSQKEILQMMSKLGQGHQTVSKAANNPKISYNWNSNRMRSSSKKLEEGERSLQFETEGGRKKESILRQELKPSPAPTHFIKNQYLGKKLTIKSRNGDSIQ